MCLCSGLGGSGAGGCGCSGGETSVQCPGLGEELQSSQSQRKRGRAAAQVSARVCVCVIIYTVCLRTCAVFNGVCVCVCVCAQHREGRLHHGELWTRQSGCGRSHPEAVWRSADVPQEIHPGWDQMFNTHCTALMVFTTCTSKLVLLLLTKTTAFSIIEVKLKWCKIQLTEIKQTLFTDCDDTFLQ